jgi:hypothetical protein
MKHLVVPMIACLALVAGPVAAAQNQKDCGVAQTCNPQAECLKQADRALKGPSLAAARKDCGRMPTRGTCYGPDLQNAACQDGKKSEDSRRKR